MEHTNGTPAPAQAYEYRVEVVHMDPPKSLEEHLCNWGREGWKVFQMMPTAVQPSQMRAPQPAWYIVMERPGQAQAPVPRVALEGP